ncbi:MAG TPA: dolichyl-phosphate beta-glucosyltransferase [Candidatus Paceibacterota bacterium]
MKKLSLVIPVYNEGQRIPKNIGNIFSFLKTFPAMTEVIFVNDGSTDNTEEVLKNYKSQFDFKIVGYPKNRGKGYAVRQGVFACEGEWIVFFDIDLATPITELSKLLPFLGSDEKIIIGNRNLEKSLINKKESPIRIFLGSGFTLVSRIFVPTVTDFTCGFKCFRGDVAKKLFSLAKIDRWSFDTEILFLARLYSYPIKQIPISWKHDDDSRVRVLRDVISSGKELLVIAKNFLTSVYRD